MRRVTCKATGEVGNSDIFYKASDGRYYKSKEVYENMLETKEYRDNVVQIICKDFLKTKNTLHCTPLIYKLINESGIAPKIIYESLVQHKERIDKILNSSTETNEISKIHLILNFVINCLGKISYAGCYEIRNKITNEVYIGESISLFKRFTNHIADLYENNHHCKKLQEAFNKSKSIKDFVFTPLTMIPIASVDKNVVKHETLYLEAAHYLCYIHEKENLYNSKNPYVALKNNDVFLDGYTIDCTKVLKMIYEDKYNVFPNELLKNVRENLSNMSGILGVNADNNIQLLTPKNNSSKKENKTKHIDKNLEAKVQYTNNLLSNNVKLYRFRNILTDLVSANIIPEKYDYDKIKKILADNNIIKDKYKIEATDYSLDNELYYISRYSCTKDGSIEYQHYISEKGKQVICNILTNYKGNLEKEIIS